MEELKRELEKLSKTYVDTPEKEEKILIPFIKRLLELSVKDGENSCHHPGTAMVKGKI